MADLTLQRDLDTELVPPRVGRARHWLPIVLGVAAALVAFTIFTAYVVEGIDNPVLTDSTLGQLALWMAGQSLEEAPESILGQYAKNWALQKGHDSLVHTVLFEAFRNGLIVFTGLIWVVILAGLVGLVRNANWSRGVLMLALVGLDVMLFIVPVIDSDPALTNKIMYSIVLMLATLLFAPGRVTKTLGFVVVLSALLVTWEAFKGFSQSVDYKISLPAANWTYTSYESIDEALAALEAGETEAVVADRNDLEELLATYPKLSLISNFANDTGMLGLPLDPRFPNRLAMAVRAENAADYDRQAPSFFAGEPLGVVKGDFAEERFLALPRSLTLIDLKIGNDLNLPHLQKIAESLFQPARRNGPLLLLRILSEAAAFTWTEAIIGFMSGALLGFLLGAVFAHSRLMERGLLPYVVMSQTIPILAIAPMVVVWLRDVPDKRIPVAVIAAYLTFFPVTINTLRGLQSPHPNALELMHSYAASKWTIMWKLRFPAALPYIFTALKVSATASVVGAIIGELPSGIGDGLGRAILDFNQYYTSDPAKLWAAIFIAAMVGIIFFVAVVIAERLILPVSMQQES
jgi:NitT/TauT family transport system permease protein